MFRGYFLAVLVFPLHLGAAESLEYALLGQSVALKPDVKTSVSTEILWKHNGDKVVEFNGREQQAFGPYEGRVTLDWHSAELEITGLRYEDNGNYDLELYMNKQLHSFHFILMVIERVSKPTITCKMKKDANSGESGKQATLICSAESRQSEPLMRFEWSSRGNIYPGPNLTISLDDQHSDGKYNCTVSNPLSAETTTFTVTECNPEKNSTALIVGIVIPVVIAILVALGLLFWKLRQKRKPEENKVNGEQKPLIEIHTTSQSPHQPETGGMNTGQETNRTPAKPPRSLPPESSSEGNKVNDEQEPSTEAPQQDSSSTPQNENTEPVAVKKRVEDIENRMETGQETHKTPVKPPPSTKPLSPAHKKEFDLEEENQPGDISKHRDSLSPEHDQEEITELKPNSDSKKNPPEGVENTHQSTEVQTAMPVENEQGSQEDSVTSPGSTAATADKQGSSGHSSPSKESSEEASGNERLNEQPNDDEDGANSDQAVGKSDMAPDEKESADSTVESLTFQHKAGETAGEEVK